MPNRDLLRRIEPLLVGELSGKAVLCSECSAPAVDVVVPAAAMCREHARGGA
jgi:hypothetical protein